MQATDDFTPPERPVLGYPYEIWQRDGSGATVPAYAFPSLEAMTDFWKSNWSLISMEAHVFQDGEYRNISEQMPAPTVITYEVPMTLKMQVRTWEPDSPDPTNLVKWLVSEPQKEMFVDNGFEGGDLLMADGTFDVDGLREVSRARADQPEPEPGVDFSEPYGGPKP